MSRLAPRNFFSPLRIPSSDLFFKSSMPKLITKQCGARCQLCPRILSPELQPGVERPDTGGELVCYDAPTCNTSGIIYRIQCPCGLFYIGKTREARGLKGRFYGHAADLRVDAIDSVLHAHLQICTVWRVCIIYQIPPAVKALGDSDPQYKDWFEEGDRFLAQAEHLLMRKWRSVFPYGLNDDMFGKSTKHMFRQPFLQDGPIVFTALVDPHRSFIAKYLGFGDGYALSRFPPKPSTGQSVDAARSSAAAPSPPSPVVAPAGAPPPLLVTPAPSSSSSSSSASSPRVLPSPSHPGTGRGRLPFKYLGRGAPSRGRKSLKKMAVASSGLSNLDELISSLKSDPLELIPKLHVRILAFRKQEVLTLLNILLTQWGERAFLNVHQVQCALLDLCRFYLWRSLIQKKQYSQNLDPESRSPKMAKRLTWDLDTLKISRPRERSKPFHEACWLVIIFQNRIYRMTPLRAMIKAALHLWPLDPVRLSCKYVPTQASKIINAKSFIKSIKWSKEFWEQLFGTLCGCTANPLLKGVRLEDTRPSLCGPGRCVWSGNIELVADADLREVLRLGPKFRWEPFLSADEIVSDLSEQIRRFSSKFMGNPMTENDIKLFEAELIKSVSSFFKSPEASKLPWDQRLYFKEDRFPSAWPNIDRLQTSFAIGVGDKCDSNCTIVCKRLYALSHALEYGIRPPPDMEPSRIPEKFKSALVAGLVPPPSPSGSMEPPPTPVTHPGPPEPPPTPRPLPRPPDVLIARRAAAPPPVGDEEDDLLADDPIPASSGGVPLVEGEQVVRAANDPIPTPIDGIPPRSPDGAGSLDGADSLSVGHSSSPDHDLVLRQMDTPFKEKFPVGLTKDVSESELLLLLRERAFFLTGRVAPPGAKLPEAYSLIKLHKPDENSEHIKSRFISAFLASPLADIDMVLFRVFENILRCCQLKDPKSFWVVKNSGDILPFLQSHPKVTYAQSKDFTGLFPTLPHDHIKSILHQVIDEQFNYGGRCAISVPIAGSGDKDRLTAHWLLASSLPQRQQIISQARCKEVDILGRRAPRKIFTADNIKEMLDFFIDSAFVKIGNFIAHLDKGIFMGPKSSPCLSNLYLHICEANYLSTLGKASRRLFRFIWRYIDDLLVVNNKQFSEHAVRMYHPTLTLTDEGEKFLDVALFRVPRTDRLSWDVFDKRRSFPFKVVRFPHFFSNIDLNTHRAVIFGQVLRFKRICQQHHKFFANVRIFRKQYLAREMPYDFFMSAYRSAIKKIDSNSSVYGLSPRKRKADSGSRRLKFPPTRKPKKSIALVPK